MEINFPELEKEILEYWKKDDTFQKSLKQRKKAPNFVFFEGPPTANGKPGIHHVLARAFKDIVCRYKTMQGFLVLRKSGWDTHGLPVELEVEKKLGLKNKKDIEKYGIAAFNKKCKESVWSYKQDWEKLTERIGFWLDMKNPYITYETNYIESVWWIIKKIWEKGLLFQDYKVVPYCPRCGTPLSSHEVALGYKTVKENSIYVKFKTGDNKYFLVWTTTPWTLPANVALAINPDITYIEASFGSNEVYILAKDRLSHLEQQFKLKTNIIREIKGKDFVGSKYEQLIDFAKAKAPAFTVLPGDFVSTEDGTGMVHIAPAFGQDDMEIIKKQNSKLRPEEQFPILLTVDEEGKMRPEIKSWAGMFVKDADPLIVADLKAKNMLFGEELYEHEYPFCWRCSTPLLYYAKRSWFIKTTAVKKELIANNEKINWVPDHLKEGRFGEWLNDLKDWTFSRERYWGTPLPVWKCKKCDHQEVVGSRKDLIEKKFTTNRFFILRHGESLRNVQHTISSWPEKSPCPLTKKGEKEAEAAAKELVAKKIDLIFSSDLLRTRQTAEIVGEKIGVKPVFEEAMRELDMGIFNGQKIDEIAKFFDPEKKLSRLEFYLKRFKTRTPEGENYIDAQKRIVKFVKEINEKYQGKNILLVSHEMILTLLEVAMEGLSFEETVDFRDKLKIKTGELREIDFKVLPYNEDGELDFHRPFIDEVKFSCEKCGGPMERVKEVIDVWFDAGSMPYAQYHYPFENKKLQTSQFPAEYISEAVDQTRGWFFTLLAISTLLEKGPAYKNVISLGHVLDEKGEKMSKSKGNIVDPWYIAEKYGVDAARWYFYSVNPPGEPKLFSERGVDQTLKKFIMTLWNCYLFYETYAGKKKDEKYYKTFRKLGLKKLGALDRWIVSELHEIIGEAEKNIDNYDITSAARKMESFLIDNLSNWYIRRSRKRLQKSENRKDFDDASRVLGYVLFEFSLICAPFIPFLSEKIYRSVVKSESVHLADWPKINKKLVDRNLNQKMREVRQIAALGLQARAKAGIKVRQPLSDIKIKNENLKKENGLLDLIKEELNVKEVSFDKTIKEEIELDTLITPELKEEGTIREIIRYIQEMRKEANLKPEHKISIYYSASSEINGIMGKNKKAIVTDTKGKEINEGKEEKMYNKEKEVEIDGHKLWLGIIKINK